MQWSDVEIVDNNDKVLRGGAARKFVEKNSPSGQFETVLKNSIRVRLPNSDKKSVAQDDVRNVLFSALTGKAKSLRIIGRDAARVNLPVARRVQNVVNVVPALLQMYLDVDRDGNIDNAPANHNDWTWGIGGHGAIVAVKTLNYVANTPVAERMPVEFRWAQGTRPPNWQATLAADHPNRIRVFRQQAEGAAAVNLPCNFNTLGPEDAPGIYRLWIEAVDFPEVSGEANWLVELTFVLNFNGAEKNRQTAVVRIAPWIMASDLDPTHRVFVRNTTGQQNPLSDAICQWVGVNSAPFQVAPDQPKKGFARDVMKSGYSASPYFSGVVIQSRLDQSPLFGLPATAAANIGGSCVIKPTGLPENQMKGQDNGGNLLVSPPSANYPYGRILFGGNDTDKKCSSEAFYRAQRVQNPIRLDSTWLRVGHVDEMLSFVRCADGTYRALLLSLRLAYIMLRGVAARADANAGDLINWAVGINNQCIGEGIYTQDGLLNKLATLPAFVPPVNPSVRFESVTAFAANPPVPVNLDRFVVVRLIGQEFAAFMKGTPSLVGQAMKDYANVFPEGRDCYELRVHARQFVEKANNVLLHFLGRVQTILDGVRQTLRNDLNFTDDQIIEVPVLLNTEGDDYVALTGDSVNLLHLAGNPASRCLVPKPFGPIFAGEYVYERYLADKFNGLGVAAQFLADDLLHVMEGEIHCGTNQTHPALAGDRKAWWRMT